VRRCPCSDGFGPDRVGVRPLTRWPRRDPDIAVKTLLGVVAAPVDGILMAPALLENFLDSLDECGAFLSIEHAGGDPLWVFKLGFVGFRFAAG